jgi:pantothenate kinase
MVRRAQVLATGPRRRLLGITGAPGAGKSTTAAALVEALGPATAVLVPMDGFHLPSATLRALDRQDRKGAWDTFDATAYVALLRRLRTAREDVVLAPDFDRDLDEPVEAVIAVPRSTPLVVTEGNYLLSQSGAFAAVRELLDECWYLDLDEGVRRQRLAARHQRHGRAWDEAVAWSSGPDQANAHLVSATRWRADVVWRVPPGSSAATLTPPPC